jgi:hypothetical protein
VASGERPDGEVLPACRLEAFGSEFFGEEAIVLSFRQSPLLFSKHANVVEGEGHLALFEGDTALIADVYSSAVSRLWRLGAGQPTHAETVVDVPFDPDLMQSRGDLAMRAEDHPALSPEAAPHVEEIGRSLSRDWSQDDGPASYRLRSFLIRAFDNGKKGAALFAVHRLGPGTVRTAGFFYAAAQFQMEGAKLLNHRIVRDTAGEAAIGLRQWTPRVG